MKPLTRTTYTDKLTYKQKKEIFEVVETNLKDNQSKFYKEMLYCSSNIKEYYENDELALIEVSSSLYNHHYTTQIELNKKDKNLKILNYIKII